MHAIQAQMQVIMQAIHGGHDGQRGAPTEQRETSAGAKPGSTTEAANVKHLNPQAVSFVPTQHLSASAYTQPEYASAPRKEDALEALARGQVPPPPKPYAPPREPSGTVSVPGGVPQRVDAFIAGGHLP